ncbi:MAG: class I SAM-dependent methyltransferase, partial [bacterium]
AVTIAFGIRNVSNIKKGLAEMYRIVKPDQKVFILELSIPSNWLFKKLYFMYLKGIIPLVGQIFSKDKNAYPYLSKSAMSFPAPGQFAEMIKKVGFREVCYDVFSGGIVALHVARK